MGRRDGRTDGGDVALRSGRHRRRGRDARRLVALLAGLCLDARFGDEVLRPHPVALFGEAMASLERRWWRPERVAGARWAGVGILGAWAVGKLLEQGVGRGPALAVSTWVALGGRQLAERALDVASALERGDLVEARRLLPALVGRDPSGLDEGEVARAVVESVAENAADAVVGPLWWGLVGGAPLVLAYRAANTLDAMAGHRSARYERFGWAPARLDDLLGLVPARLVAAAVAVAEPGRLAEIGRAVVLDAPAHPSPNAGVAEAAFAAALSRRLGGRNVYDGRIDERPRLGEGPAPEVADIRRAVALLGKVQGVLAGMCLGAMVGVWRQR